MAVRLLGADEAVAKLDELAEVLFDCVEGGASVHFLPGLSRADARNFFAEVASEVRAGDRLLLAAFDGGAVVGTVQVVLTSPPNQPHRGEVAKMLVHRGARGRGVGAALLSAAEAAAANAGKWLLVLDTVEGSAADRLYTRAGWTRVGRIPEYAFSADGGLCATVIFYKRLASPLTPD